MRVVLAGYNVDVNCLNDGNCGVFTPETLAAAYARISRDPSDIPELRLDAIQDVDAARKSNKAIVFDMGHSSIAEHAVLNFDIMGISRLAVEWLEGFRLASFTEKSQRYVSLDHDYVLPKELVGTPYETRFVELMEEQASAYKIICQHLEDEIRRDGKKVTKKRRSRITEDARYIASLATTTQLGMTVNARELELMICRAAANPLREIQELGERLYAISQDIVPSLVRYVEPCDWDKKVMAIPSCAKDLPKNSNCSESTNVVLIGRDLSTKVRDLFCALLFRISSIPYEDIVRHIWKEDDMEAWIKEHLRDIKSFHAVPREWEHVSFTFSISVSASAYAQLKRHRMSTQTAQQYMSDRYGIPVSIDKSELNGCVEVAMWNSTMLHDDLIRDGYGKVADYALTNAHVRRVLVTMNMREIYHFVRLRSDKHAQEEIRSVAKNMEDVIKQVSPALALLLCGKDVFEEKYADIFSR